VKVGVGLVVDMMLLLLEAQKDFASGVLMVAAW
jgi:hypothetical protein